MEKPRERMNGGEKNGVWRRKGYSVNEKRMAWGE